MQHKSDRSEPHYPRHAGVIRTRESPFVCSPPVGTRAAQETKKPFQRRPEEGRLGIAPITGLSHQAGETERVYLALWSTNGGANAGCFAFNVVSIASATLRRFPRLRGNPKRIQSQLGIRSTRVLCGSEPTRKSPTVIGCHLRGRSQPAILARVWSRSIHSMSTR